MNALTLGYILVALALPPVVFAVLLPLLRKRGLLPVIFRGRAVLVGTASLITCILIIGFVGGLPLISGVFGPSEAAAGTSDDPTGPNVFRRADVYVFPFEGWGDVAQRQEIGDTMSRIILETIKGAEVHAAKGDEGEIPLDIFQTENVDPAIIRHYRDRVPFTCVFGHVGNHPDGRYEVSVYVMSASKTLSVKTLLEKEIFVLASPTAAEDAAKKLGEEIVGVLP